MNRSIEGPHGPTGGDAGSKNHKGRPNRIRRVTGRVWPFVKKHYPWSVALAALLVGLAALWVGLHDRAVAESPDERELHAAVPPQVASDCHPYDQGELADVQGELAADSLLSTARARVVCKTVHGGPGSGPESVYYLSFYNLDTLRKFMMRYAEYLRKVGSGCDEGFLAHERWIDNGGEVRGDLLCRQTNEHSILAWSETENSARADVFLVGMAFMPDLEHSEFILHHWWQRDVKFEGNGPPHAKLSYLRSLLPPRRWGRCVRDPEGIPSAIIAVRCGKVGKGVTAAGAALFESSSAVEHYMQAFASAHPGYANEYCKHSTFAYSDYGDTYRRQAPTGKLLCYVFKGIQWFVWTVTEAHLFAYAARADENQRRLFHQWSHSLSQTRHPQP